MTIEELRTQGFYIKNVTKKQWKKWAPQIQEITGLKWHRGQDLSQKFYGAQCDIGYTPKNGGITYDWDEDTVSSVHFHFETLKEFRHAIGLYNKYKELRKHGFEIARVTAKDLECGVFEKLKLTWEDTTSVTDFTPPSPTFYLHWLLDESYGLTWDRTSVSEELDTPELHKFNSFQEFLDYLGWKEEDLDE